MTEVIEVPVNLKECSCTEKKLEVHSFDETFENVKCKCECGCLHDFPEASIKQSEDGRFVLEEIPWADLKAGDLAIIEDGCEYEVDGDTHTVRKIKVIGK